MQESAQSPTQNKINLRRTISASYLGQDLTPTAASLLWPRKVVVTVLRGNCQQKQTGVLLIPVQRFVSSEHIATVGDGDGRYLGPVVRGKAPQTIMKENRIHEMHCPLYCSRLLTSSVDLCEEASGEIIDMLQHVGHRTSGKAVMRGHHANQFP